MMERSLTSPHAVRYQSPAEAQAIVSTSESCRQLPQRATLRAPFPPVRYSSRHCCWGRRSVIFVCCCRRVPAQHVAVQDLVRSHWNRCGWCTDPRVRRFRHLQMLLQIFVVEPSKQEGWRVRHRNAEPSAAVSAGQPDWLPASSVTGINCVPGIDQSVCLLRV